MTAKQAKLLAADEQLRKRLAKFMAQQCFRNTELENLHAGEVRCSQKGDFSDVKVMTPYGDIPWHNLSRLNDAEMKMLMIEVVNKTYTFLGLLFTSPTSTLDPILNQLQQHDFVPYWNEPETTAL